MIYNNDHRTRLLNTMVHILFLSFTCLMTPSLNPNCWASLLQSHPNVINLVTVVTEAQRPKAQLLVDGVFVEYTQPNKPLHPMASIDYADCNPDWRGNKVLHHYPTGLKQDSFLYWQQGVSSEHGRFALNSLFATLFWAQSLTSELPSSLSSFHDGGGISNHSNYRSVELWCNTVETLSKAKLHQIVA